MGHYAEVVNGTVRRVIVAEQDFINSGAVGNASKWIQTSYNTFAGTHKLGGTPLRKNFAGIGFTYDETRDAFIPPKPFQSWVLDENTCQWVAPIQPPQDWRNYRWEESKLNWVEVTYSNPNMK